MDGKLLDISSKEEQLLLTHQVKRGFVYHLNIWKNLNGTHFKLQYRFANFNTLLMCINKYISTSVKFFFEHTAVQCFFKFWQISKLTQIFQCWYDSLLEQLG